MKEMKTRESGCECKSTIAPKEYKKTMNRKETELNIQINKTDDDYTLKEDPTEEEDVQTSRPSDVFIFDRWINQDYQESTVG